MNPPATLIRVLYQRSVVREGCDTAWLPYQGQNLLQIAQELGFSSDIDSQKIRVGIYLGDRKIPRDQWETTVPDPASTVTLRSVPAEPVSLGAAILSFVGATGTAAAATAGGLTLASALAFTIGSVVIGALTFGLNMLTGKLFAPKQESLDGSGGGSPALLLSGSRNASAQYKPVPVVLGRWRYTPPLAAFPFTEVHGDNQFLRMLFVVGMGSYQISQQKIGETDVNNFSDVQTAITKTSGNNTKIPLFPGIVIDDQIGALIKDQVGGSGWIQRTTTSDKVKRIQVDLLAANGLRRFNENGKVRNHEYRVEVQYAGVGEPWETLYDKTVNKNTSQKFWITPAVNVSENRYHVRVRIRQRSGANAYPKDRGGTGKDASQLLTDLQWVSLKAFEEGVPVTLSNVTLVSLYIKADEQINGTVDTFNCLVESRVPGLTSGLERTPNSATRNPARLGLWILTGEAFERPIPDSKIDLQQFYDWQEYCDEHDLTFDGVIDYETSVLEAFNTVAQAGRASHTMKGDLHSVVFDDLDATAVQMFTPRNSWGFSWSKIFSDPVHAVRARFPNAEQGYRIDEVTIFNDGFDESKATNYVQMDDIVGITEFEKLYRYIRYQLLEKKFRSGIFQLFAPMDAVVCSRGNKVRVNHDVPLIGLGSARVASTATDAVQNITGITLDDSVPMTSGLDFQAEVRHLNGSSIEFVDREVVNVAPEGLTTRVTELGFTTPVSPGGISTGDLVAFGLLGSGTSDYRVIGIENREDLTSRLSLVADASDLIFPAITGTTTPAFVSNITVPFFGPDSEAPATPEIVSIRAEFLEITNNEEPRFRVRAIVRPGQV